MVIGRGMVAKRFESYANAEETLIFASGISNSKSTNETDYLREHNLLKENIESNKDKTLVYFSTTSVKDPSEVSSPYVKHKLGIEQFISSTAEKYVIFRVSNLVGQSYNPNTILNFFTNNIRTGVSFNLWINATRNLIDIDDFYAIANDIIQNKLFLNTTVNLANPQSYTVKKIVETIESFYNKRANFNIVDKGAYFNIDLSQTLPIIKKIDLHFDDGYLSNMLNKYYSAK